MTSEKLAQHMQKTAMDAGKNISFVIGGADGLHEDVLEKAHLTLSFGKITWPHMLMRGMLCEQIYRCQEILRGSPYHH